MWLLEENLPPEVIDVVTNGFYGGLTLANFTVLVTIVLELFSIETIQGLLKQHEDGKSLYYTALWCNFRNHYVFGIPVYMVADGLFCVRHSTRPTWTHTAGSAFLIVVIHSVIYYQVHKTMHTSPTLYKYHRFHHRFNSHVPPSVANAVSTVEYLAAYVLPFAVAAAIVRPTSAAMDSAVTLTSIMNILVHTPKLERWASYWPEWTISPEKHLNHHRKINVHYASPCLDIDKFVETFETWLSTQGNERRTNTSSDAQTVSG